MFDLNKLTEYRENNRLEAKKAQGGLPRSIWETYSAFANSMGGVILLGVEELGDGSLHPVGISNADRLIKDFWNTINNASKVSINLLSDRNVTIEDADGSAVIVIHVPRAERSYKPVYLEGNPFGGSYRRNGEGDYKCTKEEVQAMIRDASVKTQDMLILEDMDQSVFNLDSIRSYRNRMHVSRPGHVWESLETEDFLLRLGAVGIGADGKKHPTAAGLLMFGNEYEIVREYNNYFLDYQEQKEDTIRWTDRIVSSSGDWSGNIYDFYFRVYNKLTQDIKTPFQMQGGSRIDDTPVHKALREALANCLVHADYYGRQGLVIVKKKDSISFANPGGFRIGVEDARSGGVSDPRNGTILKMFNLIDIGERAGSGVPNIFATWQLQGWREPFITQQLEPERTVLVLQIPDDISAKPTIKTDDKRPTIKTDDKRPTIKTDDKKAAIKEETKARILTYIAEHPESKTTDIANAIALKSTQTKTYLAELVKDGKIAANGGNRNRTYSKI